MGAFAVFSFVSLWHFPVFLLRLICFYFSVAFLSLNHVLLFSVLEGVVCIMYKAIFSLVLWFMASCLSLLPCFVVQSCSFGSTFITRTSSRFTLAYLLTSASKGLLFSETWVLLGDLFGN